jgi:hypothetical protein
VRVARHRRVSASRYPNGDGAGWRPTELLKEALKWAARALGAGAVHWLLNQFCPPNG